MLPVKYEKFKSLFDFKPERGSSNCGDRNPRLKTSYDQDLRNPKKDSRNPIEVRTSEGVKGKETWSDPKCSKDRVRQWKRKESGTFKEYHKVKRSYVKPGHTEKISAQGQDFEDNYGSGRKNSYNIEFDNESERMHRRTIWYPSCPKSDDMQLGEENTQLIDHQTSNEKTHRFPQWSSLQPLPLPPLFDNLNHKNQVYFHMKNKVEFQKQVDSKSRSVVENRTNKDAYSRRSASDRFEQLWEKYHQLDNNNKQNNPSSFGAHLGSQSVEGIDNCSSLNKNFDSKSTLTEFNKSMEGLFDKYVTESADDKTSWWSSNNDTKSVDHSGQSYQECRNKSNKWSYEQGHATYENRASQSTRSLIHSINYSRLCDAQKDHFQVFNGAMANERRDESNENTNQHWVVDYKHSKLCLNHAEYFQEIDNSKSSHGKWQKSEENISKPWIVDYEHSKLYNSQSDNSQVYDGARLQTWKQESNGNSIILRTEDYKHSKLFYTQADSTQVCDDVRLHKRSEDSNENRNQFWTKYYKHSKLFDSQAYNSQVKDVARFHENRQESNENRNRFGTEDYEHSELLDVRMDNTKVNEGVRLPERRKESDENIIQLWTKDNKQHLDQRHSVHGERKLDFSALFDGVEPSGSTNMNTFYPRMNQHRQKKKRGHRFSKIGKYCHKRK